MTLKNFPRGGKKPQDKKPIESFKKNLNTKRDREEKKRKSKEAFKEETNLVATTVERLSYATLREGLIVLGRVYEVTEYDLLISLPGGTVGRVQVTDISESYTNLLQSIIKSENDQPTEFKPLPALYSPGDYVVCCVKNIQPQEKWQVALSIEPRVINENVDINYLSKGSKVACTISSIEDHGYIADMGITNVRAFVSRNEGESKDCYFPGKQLLCHVKEINVSENAWTVKLSALEECVWAVNTVEIKSLDSLVPGTRFMLRVKQVLSNGVRVSFDKKKVGYVNQLYLDKPLSSYEKGMHVIGMLLYIVPTLKFAQFSLLMGESKEESLKPGTIIGKATALFRESNGIMLQLTESGLRGFVPLKRTEIDYNKIVEKIAPGTKHKCRVLSYNWMDGTYVCTMQRALLEQKYFSLSDFKPGDITSVKVKRVNMESGFVSVLVGKINGYVTPEHVSDTGLSALKKMKVGDQFEARVLAIDNVRKKVSFTLKKSLIMSDLPILRDIRDAKVGSRHHGTVVQINKNGLLIRFFEDVKGWVPRTALNKETAKVNWNYSVGQTVIAKIETVDTALGKMILSLLTVEDNKEELCSLNLVIGEHVEGTVTESSTQGVYLRINKNDGKYVSTGFLPAGHMSPCMQVAPLLASKCIPGDTLSALVFATTPSLILTRTFLPQEEYRHFDRLKIGDSIPCSIRDIERDGLRVILPITGCTPLTFVSYTNVTNFNLLHTNQIVFGKIVSINKKEKQLNLTLTLKKVYDGSHDPTNGMMPAVDVLNLYFNKLYELARNPFYQSRPISSVKLGQRVTGEITKITPEGLVVQLENKLLATVRKDHYTGNPKIGDTVKGTVIWKDYVHEFVDITLLPKIIRRISEKQNKMLNVSPGMTLRGEVLLVTHWFILAVLKGQGKGSLVALPARRHANDLLPDLTPYVVHSKVRCYVIINGNEADILPICMVKSAFEVKTRSAEKKATLSKKLKRKKATDENYETCTSNKKIKIQQGNDKTKENTFDSSENYSSNEDTKEGILDEVQNGSGGKSEDPGVTLTEENKDLNEVDVKPAIPECGFFWDDKPDANLLNKSGTSSESEDETEKQPKQKKKKLNSAERREQERQKEREIRQREEALASNQLPNSVDQFDRLVLASPDSSLIWLQYMAYHLQATEIEKARAVARRAIKTINFREENERLNVWNAWLNFESKFGTPDSLNDVFQEAVRTNDPLKIYTHMLTVYVDSGRLTELEKTINTMVGKFKQDPQAWIECGTAFLKAGLKEKSRHIMQRALQSLPSSHHVNLMVRFAILENKFGDKERSQTLFEQILSSYPKRVDVWSSYVDSLIKSEDINIARKVLERAVVQVLPARKMKTLFKKFIHFEEQYGTPEDVKRVQEMAAEYVEKQCHKESA